MISLLVLLAQIVASIALLGTLALYVAWIAAKAIARAQLRRRARGLTGVGEHQSHG